MSLRLGRWHNGKAREREARASNRTKKKLNRLTNPRWGDSRKREREAKTWLVCLSSQTTVCWPMCVLRKCERSHATDDAPPTIILLVQVEEKISWLIRAFHWSILADEHDMTLALILVKKNIGLPTRRRFFAKIFRENRVIQLQFIVTENQSALGPENLAEKLARCITTRI